MKPRAVSNAAHESTVGHPTQQQLHDFATGRLADDHVDGIARHLSGCVQCQHVVDHPVGDATLVGQLADIAARVPDQIDGILSRSEVESRLPDIKFPDFRLVREIGRGGMGIIYEAQQISLGRRVAIKILSPHLATGVAAKKRFEREARAVASLRHSNIVPVFSVGQQDGVSYFAMMLIEGRSLDRIINDWRRDLSESAFDNAETFSVDGLDTDGPPARNVPPRSSERTSSVAPELPQPNSVEHVTLVAQLGMQAASALAFSHDAGILHRDIKPSNLILDANRTLWVTDFGLAKAAEHEDLTESGDILGTLRYLAPECLKGEFDRQSDLFSLGVTLYELLAMRPALSSRDKGSLIRQVSEARITPLEQVAPHVPADLCVVIHKAIHPEPVQRYQSADELAEDLRRFVAGEPILARPPTIVDKSRRWLRRNRLVATLGATLLLAVSSVLLLSLRASPVSAAIKFVTSEPDVQLRLESSTGVVTIVTSKANADVVLVPGRYSASLIGGLGLKLDVDSFELAPEATQMLTVVKLDPLTLVAPFSPGEIEATRALLAESLGRQAVETNSLGMEFALIPRGECVLGDSTEQTQIVQITRSFYLGRHEVTVAQFQAFVTETEYRTASEKLGTWGITKDGVYERMAHINWHSPGYRQTADFPATCLTHVDARAFCVWLSQKEGRTYRLPTSAEWEYACRAGTTTKYYTGETIVPSQANLRFPGSKDMLTEVGSYPPNAFGLFDMHGSTIEMSNDPPAPYGPEPVQDPGLHLHGTRPPVGSWRDVAWWDVPSNAGSARRGEKNAEAAAVAFGFRIVCEIHDGEASLVPPLSSDINKTDSNSGSSVTPPPITLKTIKPGMKQWEIAETAATWSESLKTPAVGVDSIDQTLVLIPPGEFEMGSPKGHVAAEKAQLWPLHGHPVRLTKPFYIGRHEVTLGQFRQFVEESKYVPSSRTGASQYFRFTDGTIKADTALQWDAPGYPPDDQRPVTCVNAIDAEAFCAWLSERDNATYRLPTAAEWEYVSRACTSTLTPFGETVTDQNTLYWSHIAPANRPARVGSFAQNPFGVCEMSGNVCEWTADAAVSYEPDVAVEDPFNVPQSPDDLRWVRGGGWLSNPPRLRSFDANRWSGQRARSVELGFRVVREISESGSSTLQAEQPTTLPEPEEKTLPDGDSEIRASEVVTIETSTPGWLSSPFGVAEIQSARQLLQERDGLAVMMPTAVGLDMALIPPGDFVTRTERSKQFRLYNMPHHQVRITRAFYISETEVTLEMFRQFAEASGYRSATEDGQAEVGIWNWVNWKKVDDRSWRSPGYEAKSTFPVTCITTLDAEAFCEWLSKKDGRTFRLPTEAEWEYACRAGTASRFQTGHQLTASDAYFAPIGDSPGDRPVPVGSFAPNAFGLFDMHGNVWELCHDGPRIYEAAPVTDPSGPHTIGTGMPRILRGGGFRWVSDYASSSHHRVIGAGTTWLDTGFRVVSEIGQRDTP